MSDIEDQVARFIAAHGVTHCPAGVAAPTTAIISPEDAAAHAARGIDPMGGVFRKSKKRRFGWGVYWAARKAREALQSSDRIKP